MGASLSLSQARRIALAAQGLDKGRPAGPVTPRAVGRTFARIQLVQIDSVNVLARSHFLPFFSRLGDYDRAILQQMAGKHPRRMMEYWAHEASYIRPEHFPDLVVWQNRRWVGAAGMDPALRSGVTGRVLEALAAGRPMTAAELTASLGHVEDRKHVNWGWNWNAVKRVLEHLFEEGVVSSASRTDQFERQYALTRQVLPGHNLQTRTGALSRHGQAHRCGRPGSRDRDSSVFRGLLQDAGKGGGGIGSAAGGRRAPGTGDRGGLGPEGVPACARPGCPAGQRAARC